MICRKVPVLNINIDKTFAKYFLEKRAETNSLQI